MKYNSNDLKIHLESKFNQEIFWNNYGTFWEIHHNIPITWFKKDTPAFLVNNFDNLYPLNKKENRTIGNRYIKFPINQNYHILIKKHIKDKYVDKIN